MHRIVILITVLVVLIGSCSNILLYNMFQKVTVEKVMNLNQENVDSMADRIGRRIEHAERLISICANDERTIQLLYRYDWESRETRRAAVSLQGMMTDYASASPIGSYVNGLTVFSEAGTLIHAASSGERVTGDWERLMTSDLLSEAQKSGYPDRARLTQSVLNEGQCEFQLILPVYDINSMNVNGYVYGAFDQTMILEMFQEYETESFLFMDAAGHQIYSEAAGIEAGVTELDAYIHEGNSSTIMKVAGQKYVINGTQIQGTDSCLYGIMRMDDLYMEQSTIFMIFILVLVMALLVYFVLLQIATWYISRPLTRLHHRIKRIAANDLSYDPEIEKAPGEIGDIGKGINQMTAAIEELIQETVDITNEKRNYEIAVLQSQVNPHFLYNTLNSIHWMATLQKNTGICKITDALTRLLKNMARGGDQKISLGTELSLLEDYITIQSIRYMEVFDFINEVPEELKRYKILRLTLQPLVENAIFHGIEPKKSFGSIRIDAETEGTDMIILIRDTGVGMEEEQIRRLFQEGGEKEKTKTGGIGMRNVHNRLKLTYGESYGLKVTSKSGEYTCVSVRIPLEE